MSIFALLTPTKPADEDHRPHSARNVHISRLNDILHLSLQRADTVRARAAWAILLRCKEFDWRANWRTGLALIGEPGQENEPSRLRYLKDVFLKCPEEREATLKEIAMSLIAQGRYRAALDELELYLESFPFQDNPTLHLYAGMLSLYLSQHLKNWTGTTAQDESLLRSAQIRFERALAIDPESEVAKTYQDLIQRASPGMNADIAFGGKDESDEESL